MTSSKVPQCDPDKLAFPQVISTSVIVFQNQLIFVDDHTNSHWFNPLWSQERSQYLIIEPQRWLLREKQSYLLNICKMYSHNKIEYKCLANMYYNRIFEKHSNSLPASFSTFCCFLFLSSFLFFYPGIMRSQLSL